MAQISGVTSHCGNISLGPSGYPSFHLTDGVKALNAVLIKHIYIINCDQMLMLTAVITHTDLNGTDPSSF